MLVYGLSTSYIQEYKTYVSYGSMRARVVANEFGLGLCVLLESELARNGEFGNWNC